MKWLKFLGLLFAHFASLLAAYRKGSEGAIAEVKVNNAKKQEEYAEIKKSVTGDTLGSVANKLQDGSERY